MTSTRSDRPDLAAILQLGQLGDLVIPFTLRAVCDLGVADQLADGPRPIAELADRTGADERALVRALRALACKGIFTEVEPGVFALTPLAQPLRSDHPMSLRAVFTLIPSDARGWALLTETLRTGTPAFELAHGEDYWTYLAGHPGEGTQVARWGSGLDQLHLRTVLPFLPVRDLRTVVDVAGGRGGFLAGLLRRCPRLSGTLFDLPHVVAGAEPSLASVIDRVDVVAGSFFDAVPAGADGYLLKTVLPGFGDEDVVRILSSVAAAMRPDSVLFLLEAVLPAGDAFDVAKLVDVHTMMLTGGAHRTVEHTATLLARAGLTLASVATSPTLTVLRAMRSQPQPAG